MKGISVIIITLNEEKNIEECLNSIIKQDYPTYEIIVVDSSIDNTLNIVKRFKKVNVIRSERGFAIQRNRGIESAKYDIISFIDADCMAPEDWLSKLAKTLEEEKLAGVGGNAYPPINSPYIGKCIACLGYPAGGAIGIEETNRDISTCNSMFLKEPINKINGFDNKLRYGGEDSDLIKRLKLLGYKIEHDKNSYVYHKTRSFNEFVKWSYRRGIAKYQYKHNPIHFLIPLAVFYFRL